MFLHKVSGLCSFYKIYNSFRLDLYISDNDKEQYKGMLARDKRRFTRADRDDNKQLNSEEFASFLHPESNDEMKGILIEETLEDIDKDKDGFISLEEYIGIFYDILCSAVLLVSNHILK